MIDLDASRAARREGKGKGPVIRFSGKDFELAPEVSFVVIEGLAKIEEGDASQGLVDVARGLLGEHYRTLVVDGGLSVDDLNDMLSSVLEEYGVASPLPSSDSSESTTGR